MDLLVQRDFLHESFVRSRALTYLPNVTASTSERIAVIGADDCGRQSGEVIAPYARSYINAITMDGVPVRAGTPMIHAVHIHCAEGCLSRNQMFLLHNAAQT